MCQFYKTFFFVIGVHKKVSTLPMTNTLAFWTHSTMMKKGLFKNDEKTFIILPTFSCHIFVALEKNLGCLPLKNTLAYFPRFNNDE